MLIAIKGTLFLMSSMCIQYFFDLKWAIEHRNELITKRGPGSKIGEWYN